MSRRIEASMEAAMYYLDRSGYMYRADVDSRLGSESVNAAYLAATAAGMARDEVVAAMVEAARRDAEAEGESPRPRY